ncbi:MAG: hypothetical protein IPK19_16730 [Chloroflexi bacterium]|nr:hypothetical protein [Chloroflexota bacterium]
MLLGVTVLTFFWSKAKCNHDLRADDGQACERHHRSSQKTCSKAWLGLDRPFAGTVRRKSSWATRCAGREICGRHRSRTSARSRDNLRQFFPATVELAPAAFPAIAALIGLPLGVPAALQAKDRWVDQPSERQRYGIASPIVLAGTS